MSTNYINPDRKPYPFCAGCTHGKILDAINLALQQVEANPTRTVVTSDIGCVGLSDRFFDVHTFHGLHGRSFTYASGIKLADPSLQVLNLVGDGGCGIGGHHLINAARRNVGIKVFAFNNFNFGMTGGQHSVTTPHEGITATTPRGNAEFPLDIAGVAMAAGAPFAARVTAFDKDLPEIMAKALQHPGFTIVEIMELCLAYYVPRNKLKRADLEAMTESLPGGRGILRDAPRQEYGQALHERMSDTVKPIRVKGVEPSREATMPKDEVTVLVAGAAGMKAISAAGLFGKAALDCGLWVSQKDDYPVTVQSGHSLSVLKLSKTPILYGGTSAPDFALVVAPEGLREAAAQLKAMPSEGLVVAQKGLEVESPARVVTLDFKDRELGLGKLNITASAVAALLSLSKLFPVEALQEIVSGIANEAIRNQNQKALDVALALVKNLES